MSSMCPVRHAVKPCSCALRKYTQQLKLLALTNPEPSQGWTYIDDGVRHTLGL